MGAATAPVDPCPIQAEEYAGGGEGSGYHNATPGNQGGAYRDDDADIRTDEGGSAFVTGTATGEWFDQDFVVGTGDTEHYPVPGFLRCTADPRECRIGVSLEGATPDARVTATVEIGYPRSARTGSA